MEAHVLPLIGGATITVWRGHTDRSSLASDIPARAVYFLHGDSIFQSYGWGKETAMALKMSRSIWRYAATAAVLTVGGAMAGGASIGYYVAMSLTKPQRA